MTHLDDLLAARGTSLVPFLEDVYYRDRPGEKRRNFIPESLAEEYLHGADIQGFSFSAKLLSLGREKVHAELGAPAPAKGQLLDFWVKRGFRGAQFWTRNKPWPNDQQEEIVYAAPPWELFAGDPGPAGAMGPMGPAGAAGAMGAMGLPGEPGAAGKAAKVAPGLILAGLAVAGFLVARRAS